MKRRFLVVYDYGQGGIWAMVEAVEPGLITERFPELQVFEERPTWMTDETVSRLEATVIDLNHPTGLLADLHRERGGQ